MPGQWPEPMLGETVSGDWCVIPPIVSETVQAREDWAVACGDRQRFRSGLSTVFPVAGTISTRRRRGRKPLCTYRNREADDVEPGIPFNRDLSIRASVWASQP
jgi:hypothetical protein